MEPVTGLARYLAPHEPVTDACHEPEAAIEWREASGPIPAVVDDDPFLAELRRAVTDTEPLGPRDASEVVNLDEPHEGVPSGRFRLRRGR